jgi:4a-hydroxytetrahydrobiopterin dehydratase
MIVQDVEALVTSHCKPCEGGAEKYTPAEVERRLQTLPGWRPTEGATHIRKDWQVKDFMAGIEFFTKVAELAQAEDHHPDLHLEGYRNVWIELWTHTIGGLSENDFILAAKIDRLPIERPRTA